MTTPYIKNIAIAGASGVIGKPLIEQLLQSGKNNITAFTRIGSKAQFFDSVKAVGVDYEDESSLLTALKGQDALVICLSVATPKAVEKRLIHAAAEAGVKWIVPNEWSPDYTNDPEIVKDLHFGKEALETRQYIEVQGMSWTAQCSSFWYEHSLVGPQCFGFELDKKKAVFFDNGKTAVTVSTWNQCWRAMAAFFALPLHSFEGPSLSHWKNKMLYCDSFFVSQRDMLDSWLRVTGDDEANWTIEYEGANDRFKRGVQMFQEGEALGGPISAYGRLFQADGSGDLRAKSENALLGLPKEDLDEATKRAVKIFENGYVYDPFK